MADTKISALTAGTPTTTAHVPFAETPGTATYSSSPALLLSAGLSGSGLDSETFLNWSGTALTGKTLAETKTVLGIDVGGWVLVSDTWTYASATTINVPSGAASIYSVGDKLRLKQGGGYKYFYIYIVADTLLTVTGGSDYAVENATITSPYYSKGGGVGFPAYFNWNGASGSNAQGFTGALTTDSTVFSIKGRMVTVIPNIMGTSNATTFTFTLPVASSTIVIAPGRIRDNNVYLAGFGAITLAASSATATIYKDASGAVFTNSNAKALTSTPFSYYI